jgi:hypothetical protein
LVHQDKGFGLILARAEIHGAEAKGAHIDAGVSKGYCFHVVFSVVTLQPGI